MCVCVCLCVCVSVFVNASCRSISWHVFAIKPAYALQIECFMLHDVKVGACRIMGCRYNMSSVCVCVCVCVCGGMEGIYICPIVDAVHEGGLLSWTEGKSGRER